MNRSLVNKDLHSPAFIRASVPADKEEPLQVASKDNSKQRDQMVSHHPTYLTYRYPIGWSVLTL